jgi:uncharacterized protein (TIGR02118 family)
MLKFVVVLHRRPDLSVEDFHEVLRGAHGALASRLPGLRRYVQNHVAADPLRPRPAWDAVVELSWDDKPSMEAAWASPEGRRATEHLAEFVDLERSTWSVVDEEIRPVRPPMRVTLPVLDEDGTRRLGEEILEVEPRADGSVRLLHSPAFVYGIASGDVVALDAKKRCGYRVLQRSGMLAVVVRFESDAGREAARSRLEARVAALGGTCDGGPDRTLVFSIPVTAGFPAVERVFEDVCGRPPGAGWHFGNVYGPGERPLGWWEDPA